MSVLRGFPAGGGIGKTELEPFTGVFSLRGGVLPYPIISLFLSSKSPGARED
jgi:hypothetical protein